MPARQTMYGMLAVQAFSNYVTRGALSPMIQCASRTPAPHPTPGPPQSSAVAGPATGPANPLDPTAGGALFIGD